MRLFGTDGIRGIANEDLTADLARNLACTAGSLICRENDQVVIGRDTRGSGQWLEEALTEGFLSQGVDVIKVGVLPTPAISYLTTKLKSTLGVVISASHNPSEYNGIKFFNNHGIKLEEELEHKIEANLNSGKVAARLAKGRVLKEAGLEIYDEHLKRAINVPLEGLRVWLDCANGAASYVAPGLFSELGVSVQTHSCTPDGQNINLECGSTHPQNLQKLIKQEPADAGFAFDGDADRAIAVDETGGLVDGDFIMAICAKYLHENNDLKGSQVITTVMTNLGFHLAMDDLGIKVLLTKVGDKYVLDKMLETGANLGGEQSGHIIFLEHGPAGDGILTALKLLQIIEKSGQKLSELAKVMARLPQTLINIEVKRKNGWNKNIRLSSAIKDAELELGSRGRILVRPSGTEQLIRVMTESDSVEHSKEIAGRVADIVREEFA